LSPPRILIASPYAREANNGNWRTAARWAQLLRDRFRMILQTSGEPLADAEMLVALHARRSGEALVRWREAFGDRPAILVLTGTDLYRDLPNGDAVAQSSLDSADALIVLQEHAVRDLPRRYRAKAHVVYQSARALVPAAKTGRRLHCLFVGHLREEKDPVTAIRAIRLLDPALSVDLALIGGARDPECARAVRDSMRGCDNVRALDARPHAWTRQAIKRAHVLVVPSIVEGGSNVIVEAIRAGTPVLASRVPGNVGMLGEDYAGYFGVGRSSELAGLLRRCRADTDFLPLLARQCRRRDNLFRPASERASLTRVIRDTLRGHGW